MQKITYTFILLALSSSQLLWAAPTPMDHRSGRRPSSRSTRVRGEPVSDGQGGFFQGPSHPGEPSGQGPVPRNYSSLAAEYVYAQSPSLRNIDINNLVQRPNRTSYNRAIEQQMSGLTIDEDDQQPMTAGGARRRKVVKKGRRDTDWSRALPPVEEEVGPSGATANVEQDPNGLNWDNLDWDTEQLPILRTLLSYLPDASATDLTNRAMLTMTPTLSRQLLGDDLTEQAAAIVAMDFPDSYFENLGGIPTGSSSSRGQSSTTSQYAEEDGAGSSSSSSRRRRSSRNDSSQTFNPPTQDETDHVVKIINTVTGWDKPDIRQLLARYVPSREQFEKIYKSRKGAHVERTLREFVPSNVFE